MKALVVEDGFVINTVIVNELSGGLVADPGGVGVNWVDNGNGTFSAPDQQPPTSKAVREIALNSMEYDFGDGRVIQTRPQDEINVRTAIEVMTANGIVSRDWVMKDNIKHPVTVAELETAMAAGQLAAVMIWDSYEPQ